MDDNSLELISKINWIKDLESDLFEKIKKFCSIKIYNEGDILCQSTFIPSEIFFIIEGQARLIYKFENEENTIEKIEKNSWIGLISFIRNSPIENVLAVSKLKVLSIPEEIFLLLLKNSKLKNFQEITLIEIVDLIYKKNKNHRIQFSYVLEKANQIKKGIKIFNNSKKSSQKIYLLGSNNLKNKIIYDEINPSEFKSAYKKYINLRVIEVEKDIFYKELSEKLIDKNEFYKSNDNNIPYPSSFDLNEENKSLVLVEGKNPIEETLASLKMLCMVFNVEFNKEYLKGLLDQKIKSNQTINLYEFGDILLNYGFTIANTIIKREDLMRSPKYSIIFYKDHISLLIKANNKGIVLLSPFYGEVYLSSEDILNVFHEEINITLVKRSIRNEYPKLGLNWLLPFFKKYKSLFLNLLFASIVVQLLTLANPLLIQVIIDKVITQRSLNTLQIIGAALFIVTIFESLLRSLRTFLLVDTTNRIDLELGSEVIIHLFQLPLDYFSKRRTGELSTKISELQKIREFFTGQTLTTIIDAVFSIIYILIMAIYSWLLTLISLSVLPIQIVLTFLGVPLFKNQYRKVAESNAKTQNHLIESINAIQTIKTQNIENLTFKKWNKNYLNFIQKIFNKTITETVLSESSNLLQKISQIMVLWIGASLVLNGKLSLGQLIAFRIISGYVTQPILRLSTLSQRFQELKVSFERLGDVLNRNTESGINNYENINIPKIKGNIEIKNLDFYYEKNNNKILENINFKLYANTFTGIVGRSGSGKSTLVKLLARLYKPSNGKIIIDDYDIQKVELYSFRKQIGFVAQDPYLINGTIIENISISNPEASKEDVIRVSKNACAHEFIMNLKEGYNTKIEEKGNSLSGGQKQRIAIARALLSNPRILIMDEATSALDYITEKKVLENIKKITNKTTILFVTHRFQNLKNVDQILLFKEGQLIEKGTHSELIEKRGLYFAMSNEI